MPSSPNTAERRSGRWVPGLVIGLPLAVVLLATALWYLAERGVIDIPALLGTKNEGELVQPPVSLQELSLRDARGEGFDFSGVPRWSLLVPGGSECDAGCEKLLYTTRQLHVALGKDANRVRRLYLNTGGAYKPEFAEYLASEHPRLRPLTVDGSAWRTVVDKLPPTAQAAPLYLVDPRGWLILHYRPEHSGEQIMKDLELLLKVGSH